MDDQPPKKKGGRPKLDPWNVRNKVIAVRLTEDGYKKVKMLAEARKLSVEGYVRTVLQKLHEGRIIY